MAKTLEQRKLEEEIRLVQLKADLAERELKDLDSMEMGRGEFAFVGKVKEESVHDMIEKLSQWSSANPGEPITIIINSEGGNVFDGFAFYDYVQHLKNIGHHVTTIGIGMQASMGGVLLQAGTERIMTPRSWMMMHEVQGIVAGALSEMEDDMKQNRRLQDQALDILSERSNLTKAAIKKKWIRKDWWLSAEECLKSGFIDRIE